MDVTVDSVRGAVLAAVLETKITTTVAVDDGRV